MDEDDPPDAARVPALLRGRKGKMGQRARHGMGSRRELSLPYRSQWQQFKDKIRKGL